MGELPCGSQPTVPTCVVWSWHLKGSPRQERFFYTDAGKGSAVCRLLHCGTRYLIAVLARPTAQVPRWAGNVSGGPGSIPGRFWRTAVPSFRRYSTEPLHSGSVKYRDVVRPLHWPLHYRVRGWGRLKNKKKNMGFPRSLTDDYASWWAPLRAKQLSMAATARVIWLCVCVR